MIEMYKKIIRFLSRKKNFVAAAQKLDVLKNIVNVLQIIKFV